MLFYNSRGHGLINYRLHTICRFSWSLLLPFPKKELILLNQSYDFLRSRISNQSILKEISPEYSLEGLMLKLKLQYFGHFMRRTDSLGKTLMLGKIEVERRRGQQRMRWLDGITNSWTWAWVSSGSWWWTEKPDMLQPMGSQTVGHDWAPELNGTEGHFISLYFYFVEKTEIPRLEFFQLCVPSLRTDFIHPGLTSNTIGSPDGGHFLVLISSAPSLPLISFFSVFNKDSVFRLT